MIKSEGQSQIGQDGVDLLFPLLVLLSITNTGNGANENQKRNVKYAGWFGNPGL